VIRSNRLRHWTVATAALASLVLLASCASSSSGGNGGAPKSGSPLVIGASISLTGDFSDSGTSVERGYKLWASQINAAGGLLGHKVVFKIVDDASSPTQVVTNYQTLINKDHVNLVLGPFSSLLTVPASQVAKRYNYAFLEPAGGGPAVFAQKLSNLFFVQPAPTTQSGEVFANFILSLPPSERPKTAAYAELNDPFSAPIAEAIRHRFEAAGIKTVYKKVYGAETQDLTPVMAGVAAAKPDVIVGGTQNDDAYAQVNALVKLKYSPKFYFQANGPNDPLDFPKKVGAANTAGMMSAGDWFPGSQATGSASFTAAYIKAYGGTAQTIDPTSAEAYACGQLLEEVAKKEGNVNNATLISTLHSGTWPTLLGNLSWNAIGEPAGTFNLVQWQNGKLLPVYPADVSQAKPLFPKPNWGG
jgi:branched-chain amino acid transport system substrate-binding protein